MAESGSRSLPTPQSARRAVANEATHKMQNTTKDIGSTLHPLPPRGSLTEDSIRFEASGQFWLIRKQERRTARHGMAWLPSTLT
jgi:hypothetical protein